MKTSNIWDQHSKYLTVGYPGDSEKITITKVMPTPSQLDDYFEVVVELNWFSRQPNLQARKLSKHYLTMAGAKCGGWAGLKWLKKERNLTP